MNTAEFYIYLIINFNYVTSLIHQDVHFIPCSLKEPVHYESFILTVNEGLRLSCEICEFCESVNLTECIEPDFSLPPEEITRPLSLTEKYRIQKQSLKNQSDQYIHTGKKALADLRFKDENAQESLQDVLNSGLLGDLLPKIFFTKTESTGLMTVISTTPTILLAQDYLIFRRTETIHSGTYDCFWRGRKRKTWSITVYDAGREPFREIYLDEKSPNSKYNRRLRDLHMKRANLHLFSRWTNWSDCNICTIKERNQIMWGVEIRVGYCFIKKINLIQVTRPKNAIDLINFKNGLPCRSYLIPTEIRGLRAVAFRPSEMEIKKCFVYCKKKDYYKAVFNLSGVIISEYRYRTGLETINILIDYNDGTFQRNVNNTEEDMQNDPDKDIDDVEEFNNYKLRPPRTGGTNFVVGRDDYKLTIVCPFTGSVTGGFMWFELYEKPKRSLNDLIKDPFDFYNTFRNTRGRIKFDPGYNIIVGSILPTDNFKMYVCMHENKIIGIVKMVYVNKNESDKILHIMSQLALLLMPTLLVLLTLIFIFLTLRSKVIKPKKTKEAEEE